MFCFPVSDSGPKMGDKRVALEPAPVQSSVENLTC